MLNKSMLKPKISPQENRITIEINPSLYPLEAIYGAAYVFLDRAYLFLEGDPKKSVSVSIKGKEKISAKGLESLAGEFCNEVLNYVLREKISENNKKIREYIIARALFVAPEEKTGKKDKPSKKQTPAATEWREDKLGLALPWKKRYETR
jgi:His-Xaa-Ser system protein HxsD